MLDGGGAVTMTTKELSRRYGLRRLGKSYEFLTPEGDTYFIVAHKGHKMGWTAFLRTEGVDGERRMQPAYRARTLNHLVRFLAEEIGFIEDGKRVVETVGGTQ
jgi:hypothetical protein